jgi:hypothetical protein
LLKVRLPERARIRERLRMDDTAKSCHSDEDGGGKFRTQGTGSGAPLTPVGGLDYNWVQGRRATRFQINDNLAWTVGRHQFQFGISSRRLRINDYDFSTYDTPLVTYTTLAQFIYGAASTATKAFPVAASQPFDYLNADLFAGDTANRATRHLLISQNVATSEPTGPLSIQMLGETQRIRPGPFARPPSSIPGQFLLRRLPRLSMAVQMLENRRRARTADIGTWAGPLGVPFR